MSTPADLYEQDFYAWTQEQASKLRSGDLATLDLAHLAEELESMGRSERRELINRLAVLLAHLLKWQYQAERRGSGKSWRATIKEQRRQVQRVLKDSPSLQRGLGDSVAEAYGDAIQKVVRETPLEEAELPPDCPFTLAQVLDNGFWPGGDHDA
jgi:hypothetical protein